jgi:hypothetical protein
VFERYQPALMYLSPTDIQHKHAPGTWALTAFINVLISTLPLTPVALS